jgi:hypothetical protein
MSDKKPLFVTADQADQAYRDGEVIQHKTTAGNTFRNISQPNALIGAITTSSAPANRFPPRMSTSSAPACRPTTASALCATSST